MLMMMLMIRACIAALQCPSHHPSTLPPVFSNDRVETALLSTAIIATPQSRHFLSTRRMNRLSVLQAHSRSRPHAAMRAADQYDDTCAPSYERLRRIDAVRSDSVPPHFRLFGWLILLPS